LGGEAAAAGRVEPQAGVRVRRLARADEDNRFVCRVAAGILLSRYFMKAQILVAKHPPGDNIMGRLLTSNLAPEYPSADETVEEWVSVRRRIRDSEAGKRTGDDSEDNECQARSRYG